MDFEPNGTSTMTDNTLQNLRNAHRPEMAKICEQFWNTPIAEYAQQLWTPPSSTLPGLETELLQAMHSEFLRLQYPTSQIRALLDSFKRTRVLQTATHLTATEGPTFLFIHQLALAGIPAQEYYLAGAYSGVPFSNNAWSGCLNYGSKTALEDLVSANHSQYAALKRAEEDRGRDADSHRVSLVPGKLRDARVYGSSIPEKMTQTLSALSDSAQIRIPQAQAEADFAPWALHLCTQHSQSIFQNPKIAYWDLNQVIADYLQLILNNPHHPVTRLLFDSEVRQKARNLFEKYSDVSPAASVMFTMAFKHKKRGWRQENLILGGEYLEGKKHSFELNPHSIIESLRKKELCPSLFLSFMILRFQNRIRCLGSFEQIEYLQSFQKILKELDIMEPHCFEETEEASAPSLTTGRCYDASGTAIFPLDIVLGNAQLPELPETLGEVITPLLPRLL